MALGAHHIDPASFTTIRVFAGALTLAIIVALRTQKAPSLRADWRAVAALGAYMVFFSFAYITLSAGTGALILFACVQLTMFTVAMRSGERFPPFAWAGLALAITGLIYLVSPGLSAPDPLGAILMAAAGIAWGAYSLLGRGAATRSQPPRPTSSASRRLRSSSAPCARPSPHLALRRGPRHWFWRHRLRLWLCDLVRSAPRP